MRKRPVVSVIMPTYNQGEFISRSIESLIAQTFTDWELIIVLDGCTDYTLDVVSEYAKDERIQWFANDVNEGLGYSLNRGLTISTGDYISYLPSDDIYYRDHLAFTLEMLVTSEEAILAYSGMTFNYNDSAQRHQAETTLGDSDNCLQLVQVLHRRTDDQWVERCELVTDDLHSMFWAKLLCLGKAVPTNAVTCEWVSHPLQRHRLINEMLGGGIVIYKNYYKVKQPIRFCSLVGNRIDEINLYKQFRNKPEKSDKLKILMVGELAYNPERICALEEYGHSLYGLWIPTPDFYNTIGPLPFGNVQDIHLHSWRSAVARIKPDVIYALLNYHSISLAHHVLLSNTGIPFVWHFKEGPFYARQNGLWKQLIELYANSDGQIFPNAETRDWFSQFISFETPTFILDGDLPKKEWFSSSRSELLSQTDGELHTVLPGRPFGLSVEDISSLKEQKIHLHLYGEFFHSMWKNWVADAKKAGGKFFHLHSFCNADAWVTELSKYDAGWLHAFQSSNHGELIRCTWNDLNYPARMNSFAAAGIPFIQMNNSNHIVATQSLSQKLDAGIFYDNINNIGNSLKDSGRMNTIQDNVWRHRMSFCFDMHVKAFTDYLCRVIERKAGHNEIKDNHQRTLPF